MKLVVVDGYMYLLNNEYKEHYEIRNVNSMHLKKIKQEIKVERKIITLNYKKDITSTAVLEV